MAGKPRQGHEPGEHGETGPGAQGEQCDAELIVRARAGEDTAFGVLYERHIESARRLARLYASSPADAEDIASEGFTEVLSAVRAGGGPREAFRPYVLTTVRRIAARAAAGAKRSMPTPELEIYAPVVPFEDPVLADLEASLVARAFAALPERWQTVLWHTEVEGENPAQVAAGLGLSANGVAALAFRAREGLRREYLQAHLSAEDMERECRKSASKLAAYVRGSLSARAQHRVEQHLAECDRCATLLPELREISGRLRGILGPLILGPAFSGYFASLPGESSGDASDSTGEPARPEDDRGIGDAVGGGGASPGAAVVVTSLAAVVALLVVAGSLLLPSHSISQSRTEGRAPVTAPSPTPTLITKSALPALPEPVSSSPAPPSPTESQAGDGWLPPSPNPASQTPADGNSEAPSDDPSPAPGPASKPPPKPSPRPAPDPKLTGGSFESPQSAQPHTTYRTGQFIGGWRVTNSVNLVASWRAAMGKQALDLNGDHPVPTAGAITQSFDTVPAHQYVVSFYLAGNPDCGQGRKTLTVQVGGIAKDFSFDTTGHSTSAMGWRPETVRFTATSDRTTLRLASTTDPNSDCGPAIDEVKVAARKAEH